MFTNRYKEQEMDSLQQLVQQTFIARFGNQPSIIALAPGRVNIIGEHTDYTGGFVFPAAIDKEIIIAVDKNDTDTITGFSVDFNEEASTNLGAYDPTHPKEWFRYILGVLDELQTIDQPLEGFNFCIAGNIPVGSGLSSSAAVEMATCIAMERLFNFSLEDQAAALLCQRAENNFVGVNCGIMDQYISRVGKANHAVKIDCSDLTIQTVSINTPDYSWIIVDSKKRRGLVDSEYNNRRKECEEGLAIAQREFSEREISGLRSLSIADLGRLEKVCSPIVFKRIKHVISENNRVLETEKALLEGDIKTIGDCLYASHASLRDDFNVSCKELDSLVNILKDTGDVAGARLTGAGFGGCVIALVKSDAIGSVIASIKQHYTSDCLQENESAAIWPIVISDGARIIHKE